MMHDETYLAILALRRRGFKVERALKGGNHWLTTRNGRYLVNSAMLIQTARDLCSQIPLPYDMPLQFRRR